MKKYVVLFTIILFLGCKKETESLDVSFYFWKTTFSLTPKEEAFLKDLEVAKLYIRYFDVGLKNDIALPVAPIVFKEKPTAYKVVPVVYIKNEVFLKSIATDSLALNIHKYIQQINQSAGVEIDEIQFDCDWSLKSKQNYFQFIEEFKKLHPNVSATIRLHQVKYPEKTGVPKVTSGTLMYYNMGTISADESNSIYSQKVAKNYVRSLQNYKLPLNIALPIFSWGVQVRDNQIVNLIGGMRLKDLEQSHFEKISEKRYKVVEDVVYQGRYLALNDEIKLEDVSASQLKEMMSDIKNNLSQKPNEIILYDLNENNLNAYEKENFKNINRW